MYKRQSKFWSLGGILDWWKDYQGGTATFPWVACGPAIPLLEKTQLYRPAGFALLQHLLSGGSSETHKYDNVRAAGTVAPPNCVDYVGDQRGPVNEKIKSWVTKNSDNSISLAQSMWLQLLTVAFNFLDESEKSLFLFDPNLVGEGFFGNRIKDLAEKLNHNSALSLDHFDTSLLWLDKKGGETQLAMLDKLPGANAAQLSFISGDFRLETIHSMLPQLPAAD